MLSLTSNDLVYLNLLPDGATMKKILLISSFFTILMLLGCSGGNKNPALPPSTRDLTGLEGIWDYTVDLDGSIKIAGIGHHEQQTRPGYFVVSALNVYDLAGNTVTWSYDGSRLWLRWTEVVSVDTPYGNFDSTRTYTFIIDITPSSTSGIITGDAKGSMLIPVYGQAKETLSVDGILTKRV